MKTTYTAKGGYKLVIGELEKDHRYVTLNKDKTTTKIECGVYKAKFTRRGKYKSFTCLVFTEDNFTEAKAEQDFQKAITEDRAMRLKNLTEAKQELRESRSYPKLTTINFSNITVKVVEKYASLGRKTVLTHIGEKLVDSVHTLPLEKKVEVEDIVMDIHKRKLLEHNKWWSIPTTIKSGRTINRYAKIELKPMITYLGVSVEYKGEQIDITDLNFNFGAFDYLEYKILDTAFNVQWLGILKSAQYL